MFTTRRKGIIALLCAVFAAALIACAISLAPSASRTAPVYAAEGDLQVTQIVDSNDSSTTYATVEKAVAAGIKFIIDTDEPGVYNGYTSLYDAMWNDFKANDTLILLQDCETAYIQLPNGSTIDLNDHDLTYTGTSTIIFSGNSSRTATITDNSVSGSERGGTLNITGERDGAKSVFEIGATLNVSNINIDSTGCVFYPRGSTAKLNITNCDITTTGIFCVATNAGDQAYYGVTINIAGSSLTAAAEDYDDCAVMMNVSGLLNIENSVITGDRQGLFVRAGDVTVVNSEIVLTGNWAAQEVNDENAYHNEDWQSGNEAPSAAIVAGNRNGTYFADANVTIENSTITAPKEVVAIYVDATSAPQGTAETSYSSDVSISGAETSVTGSIVNNATDGDGKSIEIAVTGGTFTADVAEYIPEGTILTQDESGKIVEDESSVNSAVAEAGGVKYTTLQGAINAAADGAVVTMLADTAEDITIAEGQDITLDLNGNTLTNVSDHTITNSGTLTIVDSGENGTVDNISNGRGALVNYGTATLNGGTFTRSLEAGTYEPYGGNGNSWYTLKNYGCLTINEGSTVTTRLSDGEKAVGGFSSLIANGYQDSTDYNDNKDLVTVTENEATVVINGGSFSGGINTLKNDEGSTAEINGGTFINVTQAAVQNWNKLTITGGTFNAENDNVDAVITGCWESDIGSNGTSVIEGGVFNGAVTYIDGYSGGIDYEISGGTFTQEVNTAYIAEGSVLYTTDGDSFTVGTDDEAIAADIKIIIDGVGYTEIPESVVATVGAEGKVPAGYESLQDAIDAAADGETVKLLKNITVDGRVNIYKSLTLDMQGYKISGGMLYINGGTIAGNSITVNISNGSVIGPTYGIIVFNDVTLNIKDVNISAGTHNGIFVPLTAYDGDTTVLPSTINIEGGSVSGGNTESAASVAICGVGDNSETATKLIANGTTFTGGTFGITGNGTAHNTYIELNDCVVTGSVGIYHPQDGDLIINGGEITGDVTGIEIRSGTLTVNSGTITGNGDPFESDPNGNGTTTTGAAIAVSQHTTNLPITVTINGGTFNGIRALYEADLQDEVTEGVTIEVTGGTFNGEVYSENCTGFIAGGQFAEKPDDSYLDSEFTGFSEYNGMFIPVSSSTDGTLLEEIAQLRQEIDDAIAAINGELEGGDAATLADAVTALIGKMNELEDKIAELDENMVTDADLQALRNSITVAYNAAVSRVRAELSAQISDLRDSMAEMGDVSGQLDELKAAYEAADALLSAEIDDLRAELTEADAELVAELDAAISELESTYKAADDAIWNAIYALRDADSGMTTALWVIGVIAVLALCAGVAGVAFAIVRTKRS